MNKVISIKITIEELKTIYELVEHQYVSYENIEAIKLIRKIRSIIEMDTNELATVNSPST